MAKGAGMSGPISSAAASRIVQAAAGRVGLGRNLPVHSARKLAGNHFGLGMEDYQYVTLTLPNNRWVSAQVSLDGRITVFQVSPQTSYSAPKNTFVMSEEVTEKLASKLVVEMGARGSYKARKFTVSSADPEAMVYFDSVLNGHTFFNLNPTYGYRIDFNRQTGEVLNYFAPPPIPPVKERVPKIKANEAVKRFEHWGKTHYRTGGGATYLYGPSWHEIITLVPELGYYKFKNESYARLVWQGALWTQMNAQFPKTESGKIRVLLDAITGELIPPDDPGIN